MDLLRLVKTRPSLTPHFDRQMLTLRATRTHDFSMFEKMAGLQSQIEAMGVPRTVCFITGRDGTRAWQFSSIVRVAARAPSLFH